MNRGWKIAIVVTAIVASLAAGLSIGSWLGLDVEIAQSDPDAPVYVDLSKLMLKYNDPLRNMSGTITYRQVFQDALWWRIMDPHVSEDMRAECFMLAGLLSEGRGTEITQDQYAILMEAVQQVWGPAVMAQVEAELQ